MRRTRLLLPTLRETPADAEAPSHVLLVRAGFVRPVAAGVFTALPLGVRTLRRIETIVREEMDAAGAQELRMPIVVPADPWKRTGRWEAYGEEMFKLRDRAGRELGLAPTHEEVVTLLAAAELRSYRDLPANLYQIGWKYRDEVRPRFGLLRGREFLMKDAYSFDRDEEGLRRSYEAMRAAYRRIFRRCGVEVREVEADAGLIGGQVNHEFLAPAGVGEDLFVRCDACGHAADLEAAAVGGLGAGAAPGPVAATGQPVPGAAPLVEVQTPGCATIEALSAFLGVPAERTLKCMLYDAGGAPVAVLLPGDREVDERALARALGREVRPFTAQEFEAHGLVKGYVGPQGVPEGIDVLADPAVAAGLDWVAGGNRPDVHATGVAPGRDFRIDRVLRVARVRDGDPCPACGGPLAIARGIVVGHVYQLGARYAEALGATFLDEDGAERHHVMGCYGVGISRVMAAAAEQHHDEAGLRWPRALAPFDVLVLPTNMDDPGVLRTAKEMEAGLAAAGLDVLLDDRLVAAGVKFADADLIGAPVQVVVGRRGLAAGAVDLKVRATGERAQAPVGEAVAAAARALAAAP